MPCALARGVSLSLSVHVKKNTQHRQLAPSDRGSQIIIPQLLPAASPMDSNFSPPPSLGAADRPGSSQPAPDQHGAGEANAAGGTEPRPAASLVVAARRRTLKPPYTVESIFRRFTIRRAALIRALTTDEEAFFNKCEPGMPLLCLHGNIDGSWEVKPPDQSLPTDLPEPALGINTSRDKMKRHKWLQEVAMHCDAWLINISFLFSLHLTTNERQRLFTMVNSLQTVQETFLASNTYHRIRHLEDKRSSGPVQENQEEEKATSDDKNFCASCGDKYHANAFWIGCDVCDHWFHGKCVKITSNQAEHMEQYVCPECCSEKVGHDYDEDPTLSDLFKRY